MNRRGISLAGFSLIEVAIALAVAAVSLIAVFGLLPIGIQTNRAAIGQTDARAILSSVIADMRATPAANTTSTVFGVTFATSNTLYFDGTGKSSPVLDGNSRYRLIVSFPPSPPGAFASTYAHLRVIWPAAANPASATEFTEAFAAFDRH